MENMIEVQNIRKYYKVTRRKKGIMNAVQSLFHRTMR